MKTVNSKTEGYISSVYTGSCVDGPGIRCIVFFSGCNLSCPFCHNPETLYLKGTKYSVNELSEKLIRYLPYIKNGGVTLSGGEPFLQADFCINLIKILKNNSVNVIIETNGVITNEDLIKFADMLIIDIKNYDIIDKTNTLKFLDCCKKNSKPVKITNVIIPDINDNFLKIKEIKEIVKKYPNITQVEFLPFKKLCVDKYKELNKNFLYKDYNEATDDKIKEVLAIYHKI